MSGNMHINQLSRSPDPGLHRFAKCEYPKRTQNDALRRSRALERYHILDTEEDPDYSNIVQLAAQIFKTPFAAISFIEDHRQWFKAGIGVDIRETPIDQSFCRHAIGADEVMVVRDARLDPRFAGNRLVTASPHIRFYAGMRLLANDGTAIGALCVFDRRARPSGISDAERTTLRILARQVQSLLELRRALHDRGRQVAEKEKLARKLRHVADHDPLTRLPHRGPFQRELEKTSLEGGSSDERSALVLIDVDHFKQVNDALGHAVGDALLCELARRLRVIVRQGDSVARLGGDEFGLLLRGIKPGASLIDIVASISDRLQKPLAYHGRDVECRTSIGVAIFPDQADSVEVLVKHADLALAAAKTERGRAVMFNPEMAREFERERAMLECARAGLAEGRIVPYYQPKVDLGTGRIVGFEALARCLRDGEEPLLPESFAHAFNDTKLARALGKEILTKALDDVRSWSDSGLACGPVAINTCAADFKIDDFTERLIAEMEVRGLRPDQIEIEVTEGVFLGRGAPFVSRALWRLHDYGIRIALDDFGTGYASLTHLKQFPVDIIKIDQSFVAGIGRSADDTSIVKALAGLAKNLGIETIVEGIETERQNNFVRRLACDRGQGFLFGEAIAAADVPAKLGHNVIAHAA